MKFPKLASPALGAVHSLGRGLMLCQLFEKDVALTFTAYEKMSGNMPNEQDLFEQLNIRATYTLGTILKKYSDKWPKIDGFIEKFQKAIDARNWIVHRSYNENFKLFYSEQGELEFNELFSKRYNEVYEGWELVLAVEDAVCEKLGYTKEQRLTDFFSDTKEFMKYAGKKKE